MIVSENIKIQTKLPPDIKEIETALSTKGIEPLRWAIIEAEGETLTVSVSYETDR